MREVVIIGAGLTGLTTAFHLQKRGLDFVVLEQANRAGGVIHSVSENGFLYEEGPNSGVISNAEVLHLFEELGDDCELEVAGGTVKKRYVLKNGKWEALPGGLKSAVTTPLFSLKDKFRILLEPFRPKGKDPHETLAGLVRRRLGNSFLNYAIDPFIIGVYAGDPGRLVPKYALPKLYQLEQQYGSFIGGTVKKQFQPKTEEMKRVTRGVFSVRGGISALINALVKNIGEDRILLNCNEILVNPVANHFEVSYLNSQGERISIETRKVISTIGAHQLDKVMSFINSVSLAKITSLHYTKVLEVIVGFKEWKGMKLDAFGGLIPFVEKRDLLGVLFMSALFKDRAPEGGALFSIFMGGVRRPDIFQLPDEAVLEIVRKEFCDLMKVVDFQPDLFKIIRHSYAIPQYEADSGERFNTIADIEHKYPGLVIGGNLRDGIGMADRILQGKKLSEAV
ncbi:MAG: protoporphyrinogen oxidase [Prolixibacteraceae bacterium]|jgi:oxygen-dependent protoporphyrinogen oxidase|nr:protoporphyrinogen oxidase [Prolixibacteraceae bacterium]